MLGRLGRTLTAGCSLTEAEIILLGSRFIDSSTGILTFQGAPDIVLHQAIHDKYFPYRSGRPQTLQHGPLDDQIVEIHGFQFAQFYFRDKFCVRVFLRIGSIESLFILDQDTTFRDHYFGQ